MSRPRPIALLTAEQAAGVRNHKLSPV